MPKRAWTKRIDSEPVQGEGSFVVLKKLTVKEILDSQDTERDSIYKDEVELIKTHLVEWNWVDGEDKPLPQPKDDPDVVELLTNEELWFLSTALADVSQYQRE